MHLNKKGTVLISTVVILSLMSLLGCLMFKMMRNNNELGYLYKFDKDIYDLSISEEIILNKFMDEINKDYKDKLNNSDNENNSEENMFSEDFEKRIEDSTLEYHKDNNKIFLISNRDNNLARRREITYIFKNNKIILIPTYKFENISE